MTCRTRQRNRNVLISADQFARLTIENQELMIVQYVGGPLGRDVFDNDFVVRKQREPDYFARLVTRLRRQQCIVRVENQAAAIDHCAADNPLDVHEFVEIS